MGSKGHFERIGSNLVTLVYLLQTVDTPFPQQLDIPQEPIVHRLLLQPVDCSCQKEINDAKSKHEESHEVKEKGEELRCGLGRGALSLPVPEGFLSLTLAFPVLLVLTTVEPLHWDTSIQGTPPFLTRKGCLQVQMA